MLVLLHYVYVELGPDPLSPAALLLLLDGPLSLGYDPSFWERLVPSTFFDGIREWARLDLDDVVPSYNSKSGSLLLEAGVEVSSLCYYLHVYSFIYALL